MIDPFVGSWSYRSFLNDPAQFLDETDEKARLAKLGKLVFGNGTIEIEEAAPDILKGTIGGSGWSLCLTGSRSYGNPMEIRFRGTGVVDGHEWIYAYVGYLVPAWPEGVQQRRAMVGSIVRVISHPSSGGGTSPAGVVASWYAVSQDAPSCGS